MKNERILIVCYTFPPDNSIGGRRWTKFSRCLRDLGYEVHVLTKQRQKNAAFDPNEFGLENIIIHEVPDHYPSILTRAPKNWFERIQYKIWQTILQIFHRGSVYDKSLCMKRTVSRKMLSLIRDLNIQTVFVTIAPFYLAYYAAKLKKEINYFLAVDFRDPWTWGQSYGYDTLRQNRKKFDQEREQFTVMNADAVISPSTTILDHLVKQYQLPEGKTLTVPHGIDLKLFPETETQKRVAPADNKIRCVYAGTLYDGYDKFLADVIRAFGLMEKHQSSTLPLRVEFDIFSMNNYAAYELQVADCNMADKIKFHPAIPEKELFSRLSTYDFTIIYFPEKYKNFISTKFHELVYLKLPILYVGSEGVVSEFIRQYGLGKFIDRAGFYDQFSKLLLEGGRLETNPSLEMEDYSFENITRKMITFIDTKKQNPISND